MQNLVGKSQGKRLLGTPRHTCEDNIKFYFEEAGSKTLAVSEKIFTSTFRVGDTHTNIYQKNVVRA
jgi:hypothetical protein